MLLVTCTFVLSPKLSLITISLEFNKGQDYSTLKEVETEVEEGYDDINTSLKKKKKGNSLKGEAQKYYDHH